MYVVMLYILFAAIAPETQRRLEKWVIWRFFLEWWCTEHPFSKEMNWDCLIPTDQWLRWPYSFMPAPFFTKLFVVHLNFHFEFTIEHALTIMAYTDLSVRGCISPPATCASGDTTFCVESETFGCVSWLCTDNRLNAVEVACMLPVLSWESDI